MVMKDQQTDLVQRLFSGTGSTYDFMVNAATFGLDRRWKGRILARLPANPKRVLDLACGTGIITLAIAQKYPDCHVVGVDVTKEYLDVAREKAQALGITNVEFLHGRAEGVRSDEPFDAVTASYLAKYADMKKLVRTVKGLLKADAPFIMHDFTYPSNPLVALVWEAYFVVLRTLGSRLWPQWSTIFRELPGIVRKTNWVDELDIRLEKEGFIDVKVDKLFLGTATMVTACPCSPPGHFH